MPVKFSEVTNQQARQTVLVVVAVLLLIVGWFFYRERGTTSTILGGVCFFLVFIGLFVPFLARLFHVVWMTIALVLGYINSRILLTLIFFLMFVPYGLISRLVGRDPLDRRGEKRNSYWHKRDKLDKAQFERLF